MLGGDGAGEASMACAAATSLASVSALVSNTDSTGVGTVRPAARLSRRRSSPLGAVADSVRVLVVIVLVLVITMLLLSLAVTAAATSARLLLLLLALLVRDALVLLPLRSVTPESLRGRSSFRLRADSTRLRRRAAVGGLGPRTEDAGAAEGRRSAPPSGMPAWR